MPKGQLWPAEWREDRDPETGARVVQLTRHKGHSHHLYFTNPGWHAGGTKLLFGSDRHDRTNLYSLDLATGAILQLTDLPELPPPQEVYFYHACVNPVREEAYFTYGRNIIAIDLNTLEERCLAEIPSGFLTMVLNCTADGKSVCTNAYEDLSHRIRMDIEHGYVGFRELHDARPLSRVIRIPVDGPTGIETLWEERYWINHVNTSPVHPNLMTFCHEGPWDYVDHRIWMLDTQTGQAWKVRPKEQDEALGHEYWHADGENIGYHGRRTDGSKFFGKIRYDNTDRIEVAFPHPTGHIHSNNLDLIAGDANGVVRLWKWNGAGFDGPRMLCRHRSSSHIQKTHVHPRFTPDGKQVLFTSDRTGYGNVYLADVPGFESLVLSP